VFEALVDDLVEVLGARRRERLQSKVVQDEQVRPHVGQQPPLAGAVGAAAMEVAKHPGSGDEHDVEAAPAGFVAEGLRQMRFADPCRNDRPY
jgi:hypothetical protein